jgi:hypothetical protein
MGNTRQGLAGLYRDPFWLSFGPHLATTHYRRRSIGSRAACRDQQEQRHRRGAEF